MQTEDFNFSYPDELIALEPARPTRVMSMVGGEVPRELTLSQLLQIPEENDIVIINDTKVIKRRVVTQGGLEILFLEEKDLNHWQVLFPSKSFKIGEKISLPGDRTAQLVEKGIPQTLHVSEKLDLSFFEEFGELALPPYIQKHRGQREALPEDESWYQTRWAEKMGSAAAPTASLHFELEHWKQLKSRKIAVAHLTLHVGLGTFLPIHSETLADHKMHSEWVEISKATLNQIARSKALGGRVWALGTTVARALESWPLNQFQEDEDRLFGNTNIFIQPGFEFQVVDVLMTNFHQPKSTLLALVSAFAGRDVVLESYQWAIDHKFRLFSYGDLSVWNRK